LTCSSPAVTTCWVLCYFPGHVDMFQPCCHIQGCIAMLLPCSGGTLPIKLCHVPGHVNMFWTALPCSRVLCHIPGCIDMFQALCHILGCVTMFQAHCHIPGALPHSGSVLPNKTTCHSWPWLFYSTAKQNCRHYGSDQNNKSALLQGLMCIWGALPHSKGMLPNKTMCHSWNWFLFYSTENKILDIMGQTKTRKVHYCKA